MQSYGLSVIVIIKHNDKENDQKLRMVIYFRELKIIVKETVVDLFDHAFFLNCKTLIDSINQNQELFDKVIFVNYQPTSEILVADFAKRIAGKLPEDINLFSLRLRETATSFAEWFAYDQE